MQQTAKTYSTTSKSKTDKDKRRGDGQKRLSRLTRLDAQGSRPRLRAHGPLSMAHDGAIRHVVAAKETSEVEVEEGLAASDTCQDGQVGMRGNREWKRDTKDRGEAAKEKRGQRLNSCGLQRSAALRVDFLERERREVRQEARSVVC